MLTGNYQYAIINKSLGQQQKPKRCADVAQMVVRRIGSAEVRGPIPDISSQNRSSKEPLFFAFLCKFDKIRTLQLKYRIHFVFDDIMKNQDIHII